MVIYLTNSNINSLPDNQTCPHCGSSKISKEGEKIVCMKCGAVIEDSVISSEQESFYSYEDVIKKGRHSYTSYYPESRTARRNLKMAKSLINSLVNNLNLPYFVGKDAIKRYKELIQEKTVRKDVLSSTAAALVYLICRKSQIPLPLKRIVKESEANTSDIIKRYQEILEVLKIEVSPPSIDGLVLRLAKRAGLRSKSIVLAKKIASKMKESVHQIGKDPNGIAAAAVYTAAKRRDKTLTQEEIAKLASITTITLRSHLESSPHLTT